MMETNIKIRPILRWAGGKTWLTKDIDKFIPESFNNYYEPFLGGASIYLFLKSNGYIKGKSFLSDLNSSLINTYKQVKTNIGPLLLELERHENTEEYYYSIRGKIFKEPLLQASQFLYLNRTSFNGIYRENLKGNYNVPYGFKKYDELFNSENLQNVSNLMTNTFLSASEFQRRLKKPSAGDLIFIDPPYTVAHSHNGFVKYNQKIFKWTDQLNLKNKISELTDKGIFIILTNAYHQSISELYSDHLFQYTVNRSSQVGGKNAVRGKVQEYIYTNFEI